ncbi:hypothetical protein PMCN03_0748 [Pasteurella multocida subsp. multocida str. HB03]|nr:hypothetical protein PMCN06_0808 [Pasteurella multocida subsp. multocida str. HN06]AHE64209.1 hypothetical protein PMCN03_0748 [Pasteurella multocida subsp. multocida str. HB03]
MKKCGQKTALFCDGFIFAQVYFLYSLFLLKHCIIFYIKFTS